MEIDRKYKDNPIWKATGNRKKPDMEGDGKYIDNPK